VTLDCLADESACRAFTYNTKAKWCFLKSDFNQLKPFKGAVAGKVVNLAGDPDIGAPPASSFLLPDWMVDEARSIAPPDLRRPGRPTQGLAGLVARRDRDARPATRAPR
jgi:hypothetical protein